MLEPLPQTISTTIALARRDTSVSEATLPTIPPIGIVAGYEILGELGRGGMGVVYKARQVALKRVVALKMILAGEHAGPQTLARFRAEAESVARFQHPNIVQVYEIGSHNGLPYLTLEFVDGGSLAQKLEQQLFDPTRAAELVEIIARATQVAHSRGIIHRDLKPANVLLTQDGAPKISDFGLAKQLGEDSELTQSGVLVGTPSYMAPEQAGDESHAVGPATDVYALGAILYSLLIGNPPFRGKTSLDTLDKVRNCEVTPLRRLRPVIPRDLETICLKALQKAPADRYASAEAFADDVRRFLNREPIAARSVPAWERMWKWANKRRLVVASAGIVVLALLIFFAGLAMLGASQFGRLHNPSTSSAERLNEQGQISNGVGASRMDSINIDFDNLKVGQEPIPGYRLTERLGFDGLSDIFQADGPGGFPVVLEIARRREGEYQKEADSSLDLFKQIRHPHLLSIFGVWRNEKASIIAREPSDSTLNDVLQAARERGEIGIPQAELLQYMVDAATGIDYLNEPKHKLPGKTGISIVHGDIKAMNLHLVGGRVKIGECLLADCIDASDPDFNIRKGIRGTPHFMSPERVRGETSLHTDQYSFAATYYHLRTDRYLFPAGNFEEVLRQHEKEAPILDALPEGERQILRRALAKEPTQRYPNCQAFVKALKDDFAQIR